MERLHPSHTRRALASLALVACALSACATPPIRLAPAFPLGAVRVYSLSIRGVTAAEDRPGVREETSLEARWTVEVLEVDGDASTLRLTLTPLRFLRDGRETDLDEQSVRAVVGPDGTVRSVEAEGGIVSEVLQPDEIVPLLGQPLPTEELHVGSRWSRALATAGTVGPVEQTGRLSALRVEEGYDTAVVIVGTHRPLTITRQVGEQPVTLAGDEVSTSEIAFALREGFPVVITTHARGRFEVQGFGTPTGGAFTIETERVLRLLEPSP